MDRKLPYIQKGIQHAEVGVIEMNQKLVVKDLVKGIAEEIRSVATDPRLQRVVHRLLGSFSPDHVITELIQNADDVGATKIRVIWTDKGVIFVHNGEDFNEEDLRALCDIGITTKKPGIHIGFMGIGFKAVFKITNKPCVFSGSYRFHFTREEVFVPHWLEKVAEDLAEWVKPGFTTFFLPFRPDLSSEMIETLRETILTKLEPICMVFLRCIEEVVMFSKGFKCTLTKKRDIIGSTRFIKERVTIREQKEDEEKKHSYLVFKKTLEIPQHATKGYGAIESRRSELKTTDIVLAFDLNNDDFLEPSEGSVLYTFLPTPFETGLRFTVNCDFLLNTQRTEPDFTSQWNNWLFESVGDTLKEIVDLFVQDNKQKKCFYNVMPRRKEVPEELFSKIAVPIMEYMQTVPSVITSDGKLAKPSEVVLASKEVQMIISPTRAGVQHYVDPDVKGRVFIRDELGTNDLTEGSVERKYVLSALEDKEWLVSLKAEEICGIYEFLYTKMYGADGERWRIYYSEHAEIEEKLKELEIVRASNGLLYKAEETLFPSISEKQTKRIDLPCLIFVDRATLSDITMKFLKEIGARDFHKESIVATILESHRKEIWRNWTEDQIKRSIKYIADWLKSEKYQVGQLEPKLENVILPIEGGGWASASTCYVPSSALKEILPRAKFVDLSRIKELTVESERFIEIVGVQKIPRVISRGKGHKWKEVEGILSEKWRDYWYWLSRENYTGYSTRTPTVSESFHLDGFDDCVLNNDVKLLSKYLDFLSENWCRYYNRFTSCRCDYFYYSAYRKDVPSYFSYQLKTTNWLPTAKGLKHADDVFAPFRELKRVGGKFIAYLNLSEGQARKSKDFLQFLGVTTQANLQTLLDILYKLKDEEVTDSLEKQLGQIYWRMAILTDDEDVEKDAFNQVFILNKDGDFQLSKELYWIDEPGVEIMFGKEVPIAWVPADLSTPHAESLFNVLGVVKISSILERERVDDEQEVTEDAMLTDELRRKAVHLYSVLLHHKAKRIEEFPDFVKEAVAVKVKQLKLKLKALNLERKIEVPCFCCKDRKRIYISSEVKGSDVITEISRELARVFGAQLGSEFTLSFVLATRDSDSINKQLKRSSIILVPIPELEIDEVIEKFELLEGKLPGDERAELVTELVSEKPEKPSIVTPIERSTTVLPGRELPLKVEVDFNKEEVEREVEQAKHLLTGEAFQKHNPTDLWTESKEIEEVVSQPRVVVRPFVSTSTGKNWKSMILDGEKVFVEIDMKPDVIASVQASIKSFRERMRKIVEVMGGNPDVVNICIARPETDGDRREGQLFFNVVRDDSPLRWLVVAARELAYVRIPKPSYAHISLMTDLIEKALGKIDEIYPDFFKKIGAEKS